MSSPERKKAKLTPVISEICCICGKRETPRPHRIKLLCVIENESVQNTIIEQAVLLDDNEIKSHIFDENGNVLNLIKRDAKYHKPCYNALRQRKVKLFDCAFDELMKDIEEPIRNGEMYTSFILREMFIERLKKYQDTTVTPDVNRFRCVKSRILSRYADDIVFISQGNGKPEIVCSSKITTGYLMQYISKLEKDRDENYVYVDDIEQKNESDACEASELHDLRTLNRMMQNLKSDIRDSFREDKSSQATWKIGYEKAKKMMPISLYNSLALLLFDIPEENIDLILNDDGRINLDKISRVGLDGEKITSERAEEKLLNLGQLIEFGITGHKTPLSTGLAIHILNKYRRKDLITLLNRYGVCINYSDVQRILTTVADDVVEKTKNDNVFIPMNISPDAFAHFSIDNLDFDETTPDGTTSHVTSMVIFQPSRDNTQETDKGALGAVPKSIKRSTTMTQRTKHGETSRKLMSFKRDVHPKNVDIKTIFNVEQCVKSNTLDRCWAIARMAPTKLINVDVINSTWKQFNAALSTNDLPITNVGYCPFIPHPPTDPNVVKQAMDVCVKSANKLGMEHTVISQDEAVYEIAYTIKEKEKDKYDKVVLRLGGFHLLLNFFGAVGKLMNGSGLKEIIVNGGKIMHEGTTNKILDGKGYYQLMRSHRLIYEVFLGLKWSACEEWIEECNLPLDCITPVQDMLEKLDDVLLDGKGDRKEVRDECNNTTEGVNKLLDDFDDNRSKVNTHKLWTFYIEMVEIALGFIRAEREGSWSSHLAYTKDMAPIIAAADHLKYLKAITCYLNDMQNLPQTAPSVLDEFQRGSFAVKRTHGNFNAVWSDLALEQSQNCDAKGRNSKAGLKGLTLNEHAQEKWFVTLPFSTAVTSSVKSMAHIEKDIDTQKDESQQAKMKDLNCKYRILHLVKSGDIVNPFTCSNTKLLNIWDHVEADDNVSEDLMNIKTRGIQQLEEFVKTGKVKKININTFGQKKKTKKLDKKKLTKLEEQNEMSILKRLLVEKENGNESVKLNKLMEYELHKYPPSISEIVGLENNAILRTGNKSLMITILKEQSKVGECDVEAMKATPTTALVIDMMAYIQRNRPLNGETGDQYARRTIKSMTSDGYNCVHIVADRYDGMYRENAEVAVKLKDASGCHARRRNTSKATVFTNGLVKNWDGTIGTSEGKQSLVLFLFAAWRSMASLIPDNMTVVLGGGCRDRTEVYKLNSIAATADDPALNILRSTQEEADTRLFLHVLACGIDGYDRVVIDSPDTDVAVLGIYHMRSTYEKGIRELYMKSKDHNLALHKIHDSMDENEVGMMPLVHAVSGCDTVSFMHGKSKRVFTTSAYVDSHNLANACRQLETSVTEDVEPAVCEVLNRLVKRAYGDEQCNSMAAMRYNLYKRRKNLKSIPPTEDALHFHLKRAILQTVIWVRALQTTPVIPDPFKMGWILADGNVLPLLMSKDPVPKLTGTTLFCRCKDKCSKDCSCTRRNLTCHARCSCRGSECLTESEVSVDDE